MTKPHTHNRVDLAYEQLDVAIGLFFSGESNVSALTLAGAAEEILGDELKHRGQANTLSAKYAVINKFLSRSKRPVPAFKAFRDEENYARNAAKHIGGASKPYEPLLHADLRQAAQYMLMRAANNIRMLGLNRSESVLRLEGWYLAEIAYPLEPDA